METMGGGKAPEENQSNEKEFQETKFIHSQTIRWSDI